jgi:hypothetical protein
MALDARAPASPRKARAASPGAGMGHFSALAGGVALAILMIPTLARATEELVRLARQLERAEIVELPDVAPSTCRCPRCGRTGLVDQDFGTRVLNGRRRRQSWCRRCRSRRVP